LILYQEKPVLADRRWPDCVMAGHLYRHLPRQMPGRAQQALTLRLDAVVPSRPHSDLVGSAHPGPGPQTDAQPCSSELDQIRRSLVAREFECPRQLPGCMTLQSEERSVTLYLNFPLKLILAIASACPGAGDRALVAPSSPFSAPQESISEED
jgi:hypothetical protein